MSFKRALYEFARCTKHNLLHLKRFKMSYRGVNWIVRHDQGELVLNFYPYQALHDIEGYLKNGEWSIEPGQTVIDVGGCLGEFTLFAAQCVGPTGRVIMMEPDESNLVIFRKNFEHSGSPQNITVVRAGLWNETGHVRFAAGNLHESAVVADGLASATGANVIEVKTLTLLDLVEQCDLNRVDWVKMDIEGAEIEALAGAQHLPDRFRPKFAIASYHVRDGEPTARRCEQALSEMGYAASTGNARHLTTWASR